MRGIRAHHTGSGLLRIALVSAAAWAALAGDVGPTPGLRWSGALAVTADQVLNAMTFSDAERASVKGGQLVSTTLTSSTNRELAVALAFTMNVAPATAAAKFRQAIYRGDPQVIGFGEITDGGIADFSNLTLGPQGAAEARAFLNAAPGETLNLSSQEIAAFAALKARAPSPAQPQVEQQLRSMLQARYQAYRGGGLTAIAPYARGDGRALQPGEQLRDATNASPILAEFAAPIKQMLLNYPQDKPAQLDETFYWVVFNIDGRPTVALSHRVWTNAVGGALMVDRLYYVSCGFNTEQAIGGFLPVENGTMVFYTNRTSTDQVAGFGTSAKRAIGDHMMTNQLAATFQKLRGGS